MKHILVIGDLILDEYIHGVVERICQEAPVPVISVNKKSVCPGGAGNVSINLAQANIPVSLLTVIGNDFDSVNLLKILNKQNIDTSMSITLPEWKINKKTRYVSNNYILLRVDDNEDKMVITNEIEEEIISRIKKYIYKFEIIILSDYNKGLLNKKIVKRIIQLSKEVNIKVLVDVKGNDTEKYKGAFLLKPNKKELFELTNFKIETHEDILKAANYLCQVCSSKYVLVTLSDRGMILVNDLGQSYHVEGTQLFNPQVIGAGDTTIAYIAAGFYCNLAITDIIDMANSAASLAVSKPMTSCISYEELVNINAINPCLKILDKNELEKIIKLNRNKKIVFTTGCFDILHMRHIDLLYQASKQGDILFVAVNTDKSIKEIKGIYSPIQPLNVRMITLSLLNCVDYIFPLHLNELQQLINMIQPNVIVKDERCEKEIIIDSKLVESWGGKIHVVKSKYNNYSTSDIITSILNKYMDGVENESH